MNVEEHFYRYLCKFENCYLHNQEQKSKITVEKHFYDVKQFRRIKVI